MSSGYHIEELGPLLELSPGKRLKYVYLQLDLIFRHFCG